MRFWVWYVNAYCIAVALVRRFMWNYWHILSAQVQLVVWPNLQSSYVPFIGPGCRCAAFKTQRTPNTFYMKQPHQDRHCLHHNIIFCGKIVWYFIFWKSILSWQTVQTLMKCHHMRHFIKVFTVSQSTQWHLGIVVYVWQVKWRKLPNLNGTITRYLWFINFLCNKRQY